MRSAVRLIGFPLALALWVWYLAANWRALADHPWHFAGLPLTAATVLWCCSFGLMAVGWVISARFCGARLPMFVGSRVWLTSMPARYVPGNVWHVAGRHYLAAQVGVPLDCTLVSSVVEQVLTIAGEIIIVLISLPFWPNPPSLSFLGPLVAVPIGFLALHPRLFDVALRTAGRLTNRPISAVPLRYLQLGQLLLWYVVVAAVNGAAFYFIGLAIGADLGAGFSFLIGSYLLARALGYLSFITPAGIGVREAVLTILLAPQLSMPSAAAAGILARLFSTVAEGAMVLGINIASSLGRPRPASGELES